MTQDEAREAILKQYNWNMKVKYQDKEASVNNILVEKVNNILEEIYAGDMQEAKAYETDQNLMEAAKAEAALIAGNWNMVAKNGGISGYDKKQANLRFRRAQTVLSSTRTSLRPIWWRPFTIKITMR